MEEANNSQETNKTLEIVLKHCTKHEPLDRPSMDRVVSWLEVIIEGAEAVPVVEASTSQSRPKVWSKGGGTVVNNNSWVAGSSVETSLETLVSRLEDPELRAKLEELNKHIGTDLGARAINPRSGVFNAARLLRFLYHSEMDVGDARSQVVLNFNARVEFNMDAKRERIVRDDLGFDTLPRMAEYRKYQPVNNFVGRSKDGRIVSYLNFGSAFDCNGLKEAFPVKEYIEGEV